MLLKVALNNTCYIGWKAACDQAKPSLNPSHVARKAVFEIPIRNGVSIVGAIVWQASYNVRVHRGVVRVSTATDFELLAKMEIPAAM